MRVKSPIFVLGSSGFGGSSFVKSALDYGYEVHGFSRTEPNESAFLPYTWSKNSGAFTFTRVDVNENLSDFMAAMKSERPNTVVNFASQSMVGESWKTPEHWMQTNVVAQTELIKGLAEFDFLDRYVHFTTPEVYGSTDGWIKESFDFYPSTPYALSRAAGDWAVKMWVDTFDFPAVFTRAANIYGEGQQLYRIIPKTILFALTGQKIPLHGGGKSVRAFIHMDDTSDAVFRILEGGENGATYHISPHDSISILNLVKKIGAMAGVDDGDLFDVAEDRVGKDQFYLLDSTYLNNSLGWEPKISLEDGLERSFAWVKEHIDTLSKAETNYLHKP